MTEHVALKNAKLSLQQTTASPVKAGMPKVTIDAAHLQWLIEQAEKTQEYQDWLWKISDMSPDEHSAVDASYWALLALGEV